MSKTNKIDLPALIKKAEQILIIGHVRPDGDCLGAGFAIKRLCENLNKKADYICDSPFPEHYSFIRGWQEYNVQVCESYDLVICVDCAELSRTGKYAGYLKNINSVNIDHHITNNGFAKYNYVLAHASSTCELVYSLIKDSGLITDEIAYLLFIGLSTDSGHFMHNNTNSDLLTAAAELSKFNISVSEIGAKLYRTNTISKTKLIARAIGSMRFFHNNEICLITVKTSDLTECGCELADTEGLTDFGMNIGVVKVTVCITEQNRPLYKVSYRSKSVDVAAAAAVFGGGGHKLAAGCVVSGHYEDVVSKIVKSVTDGMSE